MDRIHAKKPSTDPFGWHGMSSLLIIWEAPGLAVKPTPAELTKELETGNSQITLSGQQSRILDALADFAQIPDYQRRPGVIQIPGHFNTYYDRLPEREEKDKQKYQQEQDAQREQARAKLTQ